MKVETARLSRGRKKRIRRPKRTRKETAMIIERLGELNDEYLRLVALPVLDTEGLLKLADDYKSIGMLARSKQIRKESGRMNGTSRFAKLCDKLEIPKEKRAEFEDIFWWWAENQPERNDVCLEKCLELAEQGKKMPWEEEQMKLL